MLENYVEFSVKADNIIMQFWINWALSTSQIFNRVNITK